MAQLKDLLTTGAARFLNGIYAKSITPDKIYLNENTTEVADTSLTYILGIDTFSTGGEVHWQNVENLQAGKVANKLIIGSSEYDGSNEVTIPIYTGTYTKNT